MSRLLTRRNFLRGLIGAGAAVAGGVAYAHWAEPHWLALARHDVPLSREAGTPTVRVLQLSDLHAPADGSIDFIDEAVTLGLAQKPDVIVITGDFINDSLPEDPARYGDILRRLPAAAPTFATLGNHDGGPWIIHYGGYSTTDKVRELLRAANVTLLHNEARELTLRGRKFQLIGVGDLWEGTCKPEIAFKQIGDAHGATRIVLNHNPDAKEQLRRYPWDVVLCGHTHGGQVRLPLLGTPFAPVNDKRYVEGLHRWEERWLHVTRGVGTLHGLRFNCRPQVSVLDLT